MSEVEIKSRDVRYVSIKEIIPNEKNRNQHPKEQIERLKYLITNHGFRVPLIVSNRTGKLVAGHGRLLAAKELGMPEVPVSYQDFASAEEEYQVGIADNAIASWADLDLSSINVDIGELGPFDIDLLGLRKFTVDINEKKDDPEPVLRSPTRCPECGHEFYPGEE